MEEINFGQFGLSVILMVILALIYKVFLISNRFKPLIAIAAGIGLGIIGLFYNGVAPTFKAFVDYVLYGFMAGTSAVGLWEGIAAVKNGKPIPKVPIVILAVFLLMSLMSCVANNQITKPDQDEDKQARALIASFQMGLSSSFQLAEAYVAIHPEKKAEWKAKVLPLFNLSNRLLRSLIVKGKEGKLTLSEVTASVAERIQEISNILLEWGVLKKEVKTYDAVGDRYVGTDRFADGPPSLWFYPIALPRETTHVGRLNVSKCHSPG